MLTDTLEATRQSGPVWLGVHCCGNTDWSLLLDLPLDILSFDAYGYFESLTLYDGHLRRFLDRGGWLAWGLVHTGVELKAETADSLWERFRAQVEALSARGMAVKEILSRILLTPACGLGYLDPETATRALALLSDLSARGRRWLAAT